MSFITNNRTAFTKKDADFIGPVFVAALFTAGLNNVVRENMGLLNISCPCPIGTLEQTTRTSGSKKHALSLTEGSIQQGRSHSRPS